MRHRPSPRPAALVATFALAALGCTTARLATPGGETKIGAAAAEEIEREIGLVRSPALETYLSAIGDRLVERSPEVRTDVDYHFRIIDMPEPNAFALPGGYVYVSRGLLVLLNSEDELANVIGHEIAHVSARHHLRHSLRQTPFVPLRIAAGIGAFATGMLSPTLGRAVAAIGHTPGSLYLASHSRQQESEADAIGQRLVASAGWDPRAMASLMDALTRDAELRGEDPERRSFLDTHPTSPSRSRQTLEGAAKLVSNDEAPIASDRAHFLGLLDGLLVGAPASDGVVVGREFLHADLDVRVAFPEGWEIHNGPASVAAAPGEGDAVAVFSIAGRGDDPLQAAKAVLARSSLRLEGELEPTAIGGLRAARAEARSRAGWFGTHRHVLVWVAHRGVVYQITASALAESWARRRAALESVGESFRPLAAADRARVKEARLRILVARRGERLEALLRRAHSAWSPEQAAAANAVAAADIGTPLEAGRRVKVARPEVYVPRSRPE